MAAVKKYAGLPDVDLEQEEIYQTQIPELTEASTIQETTDDSDSDSYHSGFDTAALNPSAARALFEPSIVDASNVNFSDAVSGRRSYRTRRRRHEYEAGPETFQQRLARLTREALELESQLAQQPGVEEDDDGNSAYEDTTDQPQQDIQQVEVLRNRLEKIAAKSRTAPAKGTVEDSLLQRLDATPSRQDRPDSLPQSTIDAVAQFNDRLTALETTVGISSGRETGSLVPTLDTLATQIDALYSTLSPRAEKDMGTTHLEPIADKIRQLVAESERLEESRRAAAKAFEELLESRDRHAHMFHSHSAAHAGIEARLRPQNERVMDASTSASRKDDMQQQFTNLFLDNQAHKIDALYNVLPTIQDLEPLLPTILERLRALSVIHSGAADVKESLDEMENKMAVQEEDIKKWRQGLEKAEVAMQQGKETIRSNVQLVGNAVRSLEQRVQGLKA